MSQNPDSSSEVITKCDAHYITRNTISNTAQLIAFTISIIALYHMIRNQKQSKINLKPFLYICHCLIYASAMLASPFSLISDVYFCVHIKDRSQQNIFIERLFFGLELIAYVCEWIFFELILFGRLYYTFENTHYQISKAIVYGSIVLIACVILLGIFAFSLFAMQGINNVSLVCMISGLITLLIFSEVLVFLFVQKLFKINQRLSENTTAVGVVRGRQQLRHSSHQSTQSQSQSESTAVSAITVAQKQRRPQQNRSTIARTKSNLLNMDLCEKQIQVMTKYSLLTIASSLTSVVEFVAGVLVLFYGLDAQQSNDSNNNDNNGTLASASAHDSWLNLMLLNVFGISIACDLLINVLCVTLSFKFYQTQYQCLCYLCDGILKSCCICIAEKSLDNKMKSKSNHNHKENPLQPSVSQPQNGAQLTLTKVDECDTHGRPIHVNGNADDMNANSNPNPSTTSTSTANAGNNNVDTAANDQQTTSVSSGSVSMNSDGRDIMAANILENAIAEEESLVKYEFNNSKYFNQFKQKMKKKKTKLPVSNYSSTVEIELDATDD